ncbi:MAG: four helix bundle protein [Flavobacteriaceae bacterium]|nr:four helix bundle protein [Flavobacteriaceae bacterium]
MKNVLKEKSFVFGLRIIKRSKFLQNDKKEYIISKQLLGSGTAIGALAREAEHAESKADFIHKMRIALKEANETDYWIERIYPSNEIRESAYHSIQPEIQELIKLLVSIVKKTSKQQKK